MKIKDAKRILNPDDFCTYNDEEQDEALALSVSVLEFIDSWNETKSEIRRSEAKAYNADFTMGCEYAISVIERMFEEVEE